MASQTPLKLDHAAHSYISVTSDRPDELASLVRSAPLTLHVQGPVGEALLASSIVLQVGEAKASREQLDEAKQFLDRVPGVRDVTVLETRQRTKRGIPAPDEL